MIVKTMKQVGEAVDDKTVLQIELHSQKFPDGEWKDIELGGYSIAAIAANVIAGRIRTKPRTVDVRLFYREEDEEPYRVEFAIPEFKGARTTDHTITLDGE